jgi:hypothetical protein
VKNLKDPVGDGTRNFPTCGAVSEPTGLPRSPLRTGYRKIIHVFVRKREGGDKNNRENCVVGVCVLFSLPGIVNMVYLKLDGVAGYVVRMGEKGWTGFM